MDRCKWRWGLLLTLGAGIGWTIAGGGRSIRAEIQGGTEESAITSGQIAIQFHPSLKVNVPQDAIYYLDYKRGRLLAAVPSFRQVGRQVGVLGEFTSRDLASDFKLPPGITPHFAMTTAELGASNVGSALFVVETTTGRVATYWCESRGAGPGGELPPRLDLVEIRGLQ